MAACERPVWTGCLIFLWILLIPGILFTHVAIGKLIPPLTDLPDNIVKGFDDVFKFATLEADSNTIKTLSQQALSKCNYNTVRGDGCSNIGTDQTQRDTSTEKTQINALFAASLSTVEKVTGDKYFGVSDLTNTNNDLKKILDEVSNVQTPDACYRLIPRYCATYQAADSIVLGMGQVNSAIDSFKNTQQVKDWEDNSSFFTFLHCLPYFGVIAILFFTCFHAKGGVCCCCKGGSKCACLALIPYILFWLVSFIIYLIIIGVGIAVRKGKDKVYVDALNGRPSVKQAIDHVQTTYPEFWNLVFDDMESALVTLFTAAIFMTLANLLIGFFSMFECCCRPFVKNEEAASAS
mmetsp:Transcript_5355/g.8681  ORF Transcript_5355/g.8681 Transcript_5355/m.8681 type:complete len:350 (-) Transcript_5355:134-1183(-)|eukprot:CAMPEP_0169097520 /NCGR_PEP_ID=MMETSP1015-20121227/19563_1 /TAXON_ID=342587 /ORGANISM="Karlodinium micrum, Strain CCMP2283" /LENGTH=349 /DNA_ID=CAMNT_0009158331 /DNA_START=70 /DNA_END=1119 /DNA_ORIENTATION=-